MEFQKPKLILHMDINNTIIMKDDAQGYSFDFSIKRILATQCWGIAENGVWNFAVTEPFLSRPDDSMISYE
ncbi:unnamed protein product [Blepharisma stoltei]|uniref:Uncharacterized protein n=1 Tax=Blepharisma stoltei TaxID=1481888 RepID=A0AAU9IAM6_9CILI|nr:unnamed protein product [Blepharisma stoltei]